MKLAILNAALLLTFCASAQANAENILQNMSHNMAPAINLQSAIDDLPLMVAFKPANTLATPQYERRKLAGAKIPLDSNFSTHMMLGYQQAGLTRKDDQWSSNFGLTYTYRFKP